MPTVTKIDAEIYQLNINRKEEQTKATPSSLWSCKKTQAAPISYKGWPSSIEKSSRSNNVLQEELNKEILDFAKLESDIIKNVLGEEEKRLETKAEEANDIFPSFNFVPPPIPNSFLKTNPILKLYPRDLLTTMSFYNKHESLDTTTHQQPINISSSKGNKPSSDRHRLQYPDPLPKIPEVQTSPSVTSSSCCSPGFQIKSLFEARIPAKTLPINRPMPRITNSFASKTSATPPSHSSFTHSTLDTSYLSEGLTQTNSSTKQTKVSINNSCCPGGAPASKFEFIPFLPQPVATTTLSNKTRLGSDLTSRGNFFCPPFPTSNQDSKVDGKRPRIFQEETVKTFAQIVATSRPPQTNLKPDARYHE